MTETASPERSLFEAPLIAEQERMVEAILFASAEPMTIAELSSRMPHGSDPAEALVYLPLQARKDTVWTAILDRETAKPLAYLPLDSF